MTRTHVILDGLQDPLLARELSLLWTRAGFANAVDPAGQAAWVAREDGETAEAGVDRAAGIARAFGVEPRDRAGATFRPDNDLAALRRHVTHEYKSRFATALMFGLPALALHYAAPVLAGGPTDTRAMAFPWLIESLLAGWVCIAAAWPILWQGALSAVHLRPTADLLTAAVLLAAWAPSAVGVLAMAVVDEPWFAPRPGEGPIFHAAVLAATLAVLQRWLAHRAAGRIAGRADRMMPRFGRLVALWLALSIAAATFLGWREAVAFAMLLPPLLSLGAVNPWSPGWTMALPVIGFALFCAVGTRAMDLRLSGVEVEVAAGFAAIMTAVFAAGWSRFAARG